jgi:hypothetical protein
VSHTTSTALLLLPSSPSLTRVSFQRLAASGGCVGAGDVHIQGEGHAEQGGEADGEGDWPHAAGAPPRRVKLRKNAQCA